MQHAFSSVVVLHGLNGLGDVVVGFSWHIVQCCGKTLWNGCPSRPPIFLAARKRLIRPRQKRRRKTCPCPTPMPAMRTRMDRGQPRQQVADRSQKFQPLLQKDPRTNQAWLELYLERPKSSEARPHPTNSNLQVRSVFGPLEDKFIQYTEVTIRYVPLIICGLGDHPESRSGNGIGWCCLLEVAWLWEHFFRCFERLKFLKL